ncbi:MAG: uroporphyrinogen-III synthase [Alphaproteobacteria bacterium]|nr:uroporphyrinogen-III synthase [Alphaproteobacteria bacterium]
MRNCATAPGSLVLDFLIANNNMHLIVTRPRSESETLAEQLRSRGHQVLIEPMLTIQAIKDADLDLADAAALLLTSANGVRALAQTTARRDLPVLAVGAATAVAAQEAGFADVAAAGGDVVALAALVRQRLRPDVGVLVHVAGSAVAGDLAGDLGRDGYQVRRSVLYGAETITQLSAPCRAALAAGEIDGVLFFSPRSAATFVKLLLCDGLGELCRDVDLYGLSAAVGEAGAKVPWRRQNIAIMPRQDELLALL